MSQPQHRTFADNQCRGCAHPLNTRDGVRLYDHGKSNRGHNRSQGGNTRIRAEPDGRQRGQGRGLMGGGATARVRLRRAAMAAREIQGRTDRAKGLIRTTVTGSLNSTEHASGVSGEINASNLAQRPGRTGRSSQYRGLGRLAAQRTHQETCSRWVGRPWT